MKYKSSIGLHVCLYLLTFFAVSLANRAQAQLRVKEQHILMGSVFEITVIGRDSSEANAHISAVVAEISRIEDLISEWRTYTQIAKVNASAGIQAVTVDREVFALTKRAISYSKQSAGAFDISIAALDKIWQFDGSMNSVPEAALIQQSVVKVGYEDIILDSVACSIYLSHKGMKIGFGSIGKGYAADKGRELLQARGVPAGIVNASGDLSTWGQQENGKPWAIGINNPFKAHRMVKILKLNESAVATSGSYEKYAEIAGTRYSHIINPQTGYPAVGLTSVTIYGPSAEFANALSTSIMVLGEKKGIQLLKRFPTYKGILITDKGRIIRG